MKKSVSVCLIFVLLFSLLVSCAGGSNSGETSGGTTESVEPTGETSNEETTTAEPTGETSDEETTTAEPKVQAEELHIIEEVTDKSHQYRATGKGKDGKIYGTDYTLIFPVVMTPDCKKALTLLRDSIQAATGVRIPMRNDDEYDDEPETLRTDKEILFGFTNRNDEYTVSAGFSEGYCIFVAYDRLVILGDNRFALTRAVNELVETCFGVNPSVEPVPAMAVSTWTLKATYTAEEKLNSQEFPMLTAKPTDFSIVYADESDLVLRRAAVFLQDQILSDLNLKFPIVKDTPDPDGKTAQIVLKNDSTLDAGAYTVVIADGEDTNTVTISGNGYYAFEGVVRYFAMSNEGGTYPMLIPGLRVESDYTQTLSKKMEAHRFAYDQQGDIRVMFSNVLFFGDYDYPSGDRNLLRQQIYKTYQPDVVGCQECNYTMRTDALLYSEGYTAEAGMAAIMEAIGYKEAVDPVVRNAGAIDEKFTVNDPIIGEVEYIGYGGGFSVKGYSYKTFYNMVPLFYNTATTDFEEGAYYWYRNQIDGQQCSNNDCGSKAMTWGRFKDKATEEEYIVISTHMCTRSNTVRALQAMEVIDYVDALVKKFDLPIIFGGDMNGKPGSGYNICLFMGTLDLTNTSGAGELLTKEKNANCDRNYSDVQNYLTLTNPFVDVQTLSNPTVFCSGLNGGHNGPYYDKTAGIMRPADNNKVTENTNGIDRIFLINGDNLEVRVFGHIVDNYAASSADHYPHFVDIAFKQAE